MKKGKLHRSRRYRSTTILSTMATIDVKTALSTASQNHDTPREIRYVAGAASGRGTSLVLHMGVA
jgi:hypothetical protein